MKIPLVDLKAQHDSIRKELDESINRVINNSSFIMGPEVINFEEKFAKFCENKHCIGTSNGSTALFAVLKCLGIKNEDEVIMPVNTFAATAFSVTLCGGKPVFVDVNEGDLLINTNLIIEKITDKTKFIMPVNLYGGVCDMDSIKKIADKYNLIIIEDCAQSHGSTYKGKKVPVYGIGCFSFFPAKILGSLGDAGAIVVEDNELANKCRKFVNHGRKDKYLHDIEGFNFRLSSLQAAVLSTKIKLLDNWIERRKEIARIYKQELGKIVESQINSKDTDSAYYMYVITHDRRDELQNFLKNEGIETGVHYPVPLHLQPAFSFLGYNKGDFPIAEKQSERILSIPLYPELTSEQQKLIIEKIKDFN